MACFVPCLCMFCGLNWDDNVASGKWLFAGLFRVKMACTGAAKELSGMLLHKIAWLGFKTAASSTKLHGFWRNCVAPSHFQTSNFKQPYFSRPNSDSHVLGLYGKIFESRI